MQGEAPAAGPVGLSGGIFFEMILRNRDCNEKFSIVFAQTMLICVFAD